MVFNVVDEDSSSFDNAVSSESNEFLHRIIIENYDQQTTVGGNYGLNILKFNYYNGPTLYKHSTKKLMTPFIAIANDNASADEIAADAKLRKHSLFKDGVSREKFVKCLKELLMFDLKEKYEDKIYTNQELKQMKKNLNNMFLIHLGVNYFLGKSFNWNRLYNLVELEYVMQGIKIAYSQKGAYLESSFNVYKGVYHKSNLINHLISNSFKLNHNVSASYLVNLSTLSSSNLEKVNFLVELNQKFKIKRIYKNPSTLFKLDYLRDRRYSYDKVDGTYLDIFDFRVELAKHERISFREFCNLVVLDRKSNRSSRESLNINKDEELMSDLSLTNSIFDQLLKESSNGQFLVFNSTLAKRVKVNSLVKLERLKFRKSKLNDNLNPLDYNGYFQTNVQSVTEYVKCQKLNSSNNNDNNAEDDEDDNLFEVSLIAESTVACEFELSKWLIDLLSMKQLENMSRILDDLGYYLFDQVVSLSDQIHKIYNNYIREHNQLLTWFQSTLSQKHLPPPPTFSTVRYSLQNRFVSYETMALIRKITYCKNYLEIFDLNVNTASLLNEQYLDRLYKRLISAINPDQHQHQHQQQQQEQQEIMRKNKQSSIVKVALSKLEEAYETLRNDKQRVVYIENLRTLRKYK